MIRLIFLYFIFTKLLFAYNYDDLLLQAQSSIFPKIMLLDKKVKNKLVENKLIYTIVYDNNDYDTALHVKRYTDVILKKHSDTYPYEIHIVDFEHLDTATKASAFYVLKSSKKNIEKVARIAREKGVISFSYDIDNLKYGLLLSLIIEKSTVIYLNKENLDTQSIDFVDFLFQMVKFIDKNSI